MSPARTVATTAVLATAAATALAWTGIVDPVHAYAAAALATTTALLWTTSTTTDDPAWPRRAEEVRPGGRHDVSDLGWSTFGRDGRVTDRVVQRIRRLADARLRAHGVDVRDPAQRPDAERLLGARVVDQLWSATPPTARTVQTWLDAIEGTAQHAPTHHRRTP